MPDLWLEQQNEAFARRGLAKEAVRRPVTWGGVFGAVILGNVATVLIAAAVWELLRLI
jgi:hypothetical protein